MNPAFALRRPGLPLSVALTLSLAWAGSLSFGATGKRNPTSKFYVTDVRGQAEIDTGEKIEELTKKSVHNAQGTVIETKKPLSEAERNSAYSAMVYSNGTGIFIDPDTRLEVQKFVQEPFTPNRTDMEVEPSISQTHTLLSRGSIGLCTSKMAAGSSMVYQTTHGVVNIRGRKIVIDTNDQFTRIAMLDGDSTVRGGRGSNIDLGGQLLRAGQQAIIRPGPLGMPPSVRIEPIPQIEMAPLDEKVAMACMAKKTVYFDVADRKDESGGIPGAAEILEEARSDRGSPGSAAEASGRENSAVTAFDGADDGPPQRIVPVLVVPTDLPIQFTVSAAQLQAGG